MTDGAPADLLNPTILGNVFNVQASIVKDPITGSPICLPFDTVS
ncbi:MAG: hypothetical protein AAF633_08005 [Chloroflexota bacterium]